MKLNPTTSQPGFSSWRLRCVLLILILIPWMNGATRAVAQGDGALDPTFGTGGKLTTDFNGGWASAVSIQMDGKILVTGYSSGGASNNDFALARYTYDGEPDPAFGFSGKITTDFNGQNDQAYAIAVQADQKILAAGETIPHTDPVLPDSDFALARYTTKGMPDLSFGLGGKVTFDFGGRDTAVALAIQPDGKLVIAGETRQYNYWKVALLRIKPDGSLDPTFGDRGKVTTQIAYGPEVKALAIQSDGKLVIAGRALNNKNDPLSRSFVARYSADGRLDTRFGVKGITFIADTGVSNSFNGVDLQIDGKMIAVGTTHSFSQEDILLARFNRNGSLDSSFGGSGKVITDLGGADEQGYAVRILSDGNLLVAGAISMEGTSNADFLLLRYTPEGGLDSSFGNEGASQADFGVDDFGYAMALYSDGRAVIAGKTGSAQYDFALARFQNGVFHLPPRIYFPYIGGDSG